MRQTRGRAFRVTLSLLIAGCAANQPSTAREPSPSSRSSAPGSTASTASSGADGSLKLRYGKLRARIVDPSSDGRNATAAVAGVNAFAVDVYKAIGRATSDNNLVVSPYSIVNALGMIYAGARGTTADEMRNVLHDTLGGAAWHEGLNAYDLTLDARTAGSPTEWTSANKVWLQRGLAVRDEYLDVLTGRYGSALAEADFAADLDRERRTINEWVDGRTKKRIPELFGPESLDRTTVMVLVNAVALDAPWEFPFDPAATRDTPFTRTDGSTVTVPTMHYNEYLPSVIADDYQAVELPYGGGALSMVVIVPRDLASFEHTLTAETLASVVASIKDGGIHLSLPKWTTRTHRKLNDTLAALGMPTAFESADFSGMVDGGGGLFLSTVEHEAFIEVDEHGTRAAAATGGAIALSHGPTITVDRPFLYVVRDHGAGTVLFMGRVTDPSA